MKPIVLLISFCLSGLSSVAAQDAPGEAAAGDAAEIELSPEEQQYVNWARGILDKLDPQSGQVELPNGVATLQVPESFYYLNPRDAETVLTEVWGNPPSSTPALGMLFPEKYTPFNNEAWGVLIEYTEDGYISDDDAGDIDYDDLLRDIQKATRKESRLRTEQGYEAIELIGWAAEPYYDTLEKKLHWAQELKFGDSPEHTLNYQIRVLGRNGVLDLNFIAAVNQLDEIDANLDTVLNIASFNEGHRYSDFDPEIDKVAAYGLGALVAGKVAAKAGLFAGLLLLLKKFWFVLVVIGLGAWQFLKRLFVSEKLAAP